MSWTLDFRRASLLEVLLSIHTLSIVVFRVLLRSVLLEMEAATRFVCLLLLSITSLLLRLAVWHSQSMLPHLSLLPRFISLFELLVMLSWSHSISFLANWISHLEQDIHYSCHRRRHVDYDSKSLLYTPPTANRLTRASTQTTGFTGQYLRSGCFA